MRRDGKDAKPHVPVGAGGGSPEGGGGAGGSPNSSKPHQHHHHKKPRVVLTELIEEIELDTTPSKNGVREVLGGPFTFLGQYESEGTVVMVRRDLPDADELAAWTVHRLREECADRGIDTALVVEKSELVDALLESQLPVNPHRLQPPFDGAVVRGDILILRVAETDEALDVDDGGEGEGEGRKRDVPILPNEEFFLDYTKEEYVAFASRTDVVAPELPDDDEAENEEEGGDDEDEDDEDEEDYELGDDEEADEEEKAAMLNIVMAEVLRQFRENNGRGPNTEELLEIRKGVADQLGVHVATLEEVMEKEDGKKSEGGGDGDAAAAGKRKADDANNGGENPLSPNAHKRVKFIATEEGNGEEEVEDSKVSAADTAAAKEESEGGDDGASKAAAQPTADANGNHSQEATADK